MEQGNNYVYLDQRTVDFSTEETACTILNAVPSWKSQALIKIPTMVLQDDETLYTYFYFTSVIIPASFYNINENNNKLVITVIGITYTYLFDYGDYNALDFITQFKSKLGANYNITFNKITSKFTITNSVSPFTIIASSSTCNKVLGFTTTNISSTFSGGLNTTVMPFTCNFIAYPRICIRSTDFGKNTLVGSQIRNDNLITITNNTSKNGMIIYENSGTEKMLIQIQELQFFTIEICDENGNYINFNNQACYFTMNFDIYRILPERLPTMRTIIQTNNRQEPIKKKKKLEYKEFPELELLETYMKPMLNLTTV